MSTYRLRESDLVSTAVGDETVILDLRTSTYFSTDGIGTTVLQALREGSTIDDLVVTLVDEYEVEATVARDDVHEFIDQLRGRDLLESVDG